MRPQLFIDLDGVLADFDTHHQTLFGCLPDKNQPTPKEFWPRIHRHGTFFRDLPPMPDALDLWRGAQQLHERPIILTGSPPEVPTAEHHKREWVKAHIDPSAHVIVCESKHKYRYAHPRDVLVDDWVKYRSLWEGVGGIFIVHTSAAETLRSLRAYFPEGQS